MVYATTMVSSDSKSKMDIKLKFLITGWIVVILGKSRDSMWIIRFDSMEVWIRKSSMVMNKSSGKVVKLSLLEHMTTLFLDIIRSTRYVCVSGGVYLLHNLTFRHLTQAIISKHSKADNELSLSLVYCILTILHTLGRNLGLSSSIC